MTSPAPLLLKEGIEGRTERGCINRVKKEILKLVLSEVEGRGFKFTSGGRFFHIMKGNNKDKAVKILKNYMLK
jgi:predicted mannosyl-3-phosphoglycerate phosphatase (HAD superfamily)